MKNLLKTTLYTFFILMAGFSSAKAYTEQMAIQTARETWWYFKMVVDNPNANQASFSVKTVENVWVTKVKRIDSDAFSGVQMLEEGVLGSEVVIKDSASILDWAFVEDDVVVGAFSYRVPPIVGKRKNVITFLNAKVKYYRAVGDDFFTRSKRKDVNVLGDTTSIRFLNMRFEGGYVGFYQYLSNTIRYPLFAREISLQGYCYVSFAVSPTGEIEDILIKQTIGGGSYEECLNVMVNMPAFKPDPVDTKTMFTLPIKLVLN